MRIIPQEELDAAPRKQQFGIWRYFYQCDVCVDFWRALTPCTSDCITAVGDTWWWHGTSADEQPSQESICRNRAAYDRYANCPEGHRWGVIDADEDYVLRVHARAATMQQALGDFDEERERARLMPV